MPSLLKVMDHIHNTMGFPLISRVYKKGSLPDHMTVWTYNA